MLDPIFRLKTHDSRLKTSFLRLIGCFALFLYLFLDDSTVF